MKYIVKAIKWCWFNEESYRILGFSLAVTAFVAILQALLVYPVQVITFGVIGFAVIFFWYLIVD